VGWCKCGCGVRMGVRIYGVSVWGDIVLVLQFCGGGGSGADLVALLHCLKISEKEVIKGPKYT
jgi:hypothetical protein